MQSLRPMRGGQIYLRRIVAIMPDGKTVKAPDTDIMVQVGPHAAVSLDFLDVSASELTRIRKLVKD